MRNIEFIRNMKRLKNRGSMSRFPKNTKKEIQIIEKIKNVEKKKTEKNVSYKVSVRVLQILSNQVLEFSKDLVFPE